MCSSRPTRGARPIAILFVDCSLLVEFTGGMASVSPARVDKDKPQ